MAKLDDDWLFSPDAVAEFKTIDANSTPQTIAALEHWLSRHLPKSLEHDILPLLETITPLPSHWDDTVEHTVIIAEATIQRENTPSQDASTPSMTPLISTYQGRKIHSSITYTLVEKLASGGMGEVYKAILETRMGTREPSVIKTIKRSFPSGQAIGALTRLMEETLKREIAILAELNGHPNIVGFRGADTMENTDGSQDVFFVMEYVDGFDLLEFMRMHNMTVNNLLADKALKIPYEFVGFILFRIANALDYAHNLEFSDGKKGIIHLDISPSNILISKNLGQIKLSDFGLALPTKSITNTTGVVVGKPHYIAPELVLRRPFDARADLYSLGVVMYELLTGMCPNRVPGLAIDNSKKMEQQLIDFHSRPLVPPHKVVRGLHEGLSEIVMSMMDENPEDRFPSAKILREVAGQTIYSKGYGPTDHSFSRYVTEIQIFNPLNVQKAESFVDAKSQVIFKHIETLSQNKEHLVLFRDARHTLKQGNNPCRL